VAVLRSHVAWERGAVRQPPLPTTTTTTRAATAAAMTESSRSCAGVSAAVAVSVASVAIMAAYQAGWTRDTAGSASAPLAPAVAASSLATNTNANTPTPTPATPTPTPTPTAVPSYTPVDWNQRWAPDGELTKRQQRRTVVDPYLLQYFRELIPPPSHATGAVELPEEEEGCPLMGVLLPAAGAALEIEYLNDRFGAMGPVVAVDLAPGAREALLRRTRWPMKAEAAWRVPDASLPVFHDFTVHRRVDGGTAAGSGAQDTSFPFRYVTGDLTALCDAPAVAGESTGDGRSQPSRCTSRLESLLAPRGCPWRGFTVAWDRHGLDALPPPQRAAYATALDRLMAPRDARVILVVKDASVVCALCGKDLDDNGDPIPKPATPTPTPPPYSVSVTEVEARFGTRASAAGDDGGGGGGGGGSSGVGGGWRVRQLYVNKLAGEVVYQLAR